MCAHNTERNNDREASPTCEFTASQRVVATRVQGQAGYIGDRVVKRADAMPLP